MRTDVYLYLCPGLMRPSLPVDLLSQTYHIVIYYLMGYLWVYFWIQNVTLVQSHLNSI